MGRPRPGQISDALQRLREKAMEEIEAPDPMVRKSKELSFDHAHDAEVKRVDEDYPKDEPQYDGADNPHVGNGAGPPI